MAAKLKSAIAKQKEKPQSITGGMMDDVFGPPKTEEQIYVPPHPFQARLNCKTGMFHLSENDPICKSCRVTIVSLNKWFGSLGQTKNVEWLQLWYFPLPDEDLPNNTLCVSYLKKESIPKFFNKISELKSTGVDIGEGVFTISFEPRNGNQGSYHVVKFDWEERDEDEIPQLEAIAEAKKNGLGKNLIDLDTTRDMVQIDNLSPNQIVEIKTACDRGLPAHLGYQVALGSNFDDVYESWSRQQQIDSQTEAPLARS